MFETDLHAHSSFSSCGLHSIVEVLTRAKQKGLQGQAITDHGPFLGRKTSSTFFERLENPVEGIRLFRGMECNITDDSGNIDIVEKFMPWYDVVLLGFHNYEVRDGLPDFYSELTVKAIEKNPCVDIIVHPNAPHYTMNFKTLADAAARTGTAVELNNAKTRLGRSSEQQTEELVKACMDSGCMVAVNTDAHALNEVGNTDVMEEILDRMNFPLSKIVNCTLESTLKWIQQRKKIRADNY